MTQHSHSSNCSCYLTSPLLLQIVNHQCVSTRRILNLVPDSLSEETNRLLADPTEVAEWVSVIRMGEMVDKGIPTGILECVLVTVSETLTDHVEISQRSIHNAPVWATLVKIDCCFLDF